MLAVSSSRPGNRLLAALSSADLDLLQPHLQPVPLKLRLDLAQPKRRIDEAAFSSSRFFCSTLAQSLRPSIFAHAINVPYRAIS
jgi:hypothetical protein